MSVSGRGIAASLRPLRARVMASLWLLAATVGSCHAAGKAPDPVPVETFFQQPAVLSAHLSPSGRHVALTTSRGSDRVGLLLIELGEKHVVRTLARFDDADVIDFQWVNDERLVFSLGDLQVGSGEDRKAPGLYSVGVDGKRVTLLIRRTGTHPIGDGTLRSDALSWNHVLLSVPQQHDGSRPDDVVVGRLGLEGSVVTLEPMWMSTRSGDTRPMAMPGAPHGAVNWWFDSQGRPRVAATRRDDRITMYWRAEANGRWRRLSEFDQLHPPYWPHVVRNDGSLWVTHPEGSDGVAVLSRFDGDALAPGPALVRAPGFDFAGELLFDRPDAGPLGVRLEGDSGVTAWFDDSMKQLQAAADERLPGRVNEIECRRCGQPDMVAVVRSHSDRDPGRMVLYEAAGGRWQALATVLDGIDPSRMATVDFQRIKARDGRDLPVWLTLPPGGKPAPAVVLVHGGPWVRGGYWQWDPMAQFLASRGYLVINPEFRGSTGYGEAHFQAGFRQWGQAMQDDVADALLWARARGLADHRACIAGASYGGYAALIGASNCLS